MTDHKIQKIESGGKVSQNGFYEMDMETYHAVDLCPGPSLSSSLIRTAFGKSLHALWQRWELNPKCLPPKPQSMALALGRAAHALILGDEIFAEHFIVLPDNALPRPTAAQIKAFERDGEWSDSAAPRADFWNSFDKKAEGLTVLPEADLLKIGHMAESLVGSAEARAILGSSLNEVSMVWQDEITGRYIKARPDAMPDAMDFGDLKTFSPKSPDLIIAALRATDEHNYAMQMALASMGAQALTGKLPTTAALVYVSTVEPYEVVCLSLDDDVMAYATEACRATIDAIDFCLKQSEKNPDYRWPQRSVGYVTYNWGDRKINRTTEMKLLSTGGMHA